ncbi:S9 family peptidase [Candidatus Bathyarchaeota archaeon]|nr:S9 family peptidase [Candidatus Bathyarchaeota archaeon]
MSSYSCDRMDNMKPVIENFLNLKWPVDVKISPDGKKIAYSLRTTNWKENRYENQCYISDIEYETCFQLTKTGSVSQIRWINNNDLALLKNNFGDEKPQIYLYQGLIGEGIQLTEHPTGVENYEVFGKGIIFLADNPERKEKKKRKEKYGNFTHFEKEESASALYYTNINEWINYKKLQKNGKTPVEPVVELSKLLPEHPKISSIFVTEDGKKIFMNCRQKDYMVYFKEVSSYLLELSPDEVLNEFLNKGGGDKVYEDISYLGKIRKIFLPKVSNIVAVSPDGNKIVVSHKEESDLSYIQSDLWLVDVNDELFQDVSAIKLKKLTENIDQSISMTKWINNDIYVFYFESTKTKISKINENGEIVSINTEDVFPISSFNVSKEGTITFFGVNSKMFPEVFVKKLNSPDSKPIQLTHLNEQIQNWDLGQVETIKWKSKDGTIIEGVIRRPKDFDSNKKYPLAFIVHGGPQAIDLECLLESRDLTHYPSAIFSQKGIIIVKPNYRGSIGRGKNFLALNKDNLGVGDLWDIESCIEHLVSEGYIDESRVGCMGWSQGGYISAMAATSSNKFKAISVGAGISDWYTYHISTDIPYFTVDYLSSDPFKNRELYLKTSPMTKIKEAKTPTLIQHGEKDNRVPFSDATELYRGLKSMGVQVELFTFPEMTHSIDKPKENRAIVEQNLIWFSHHLLGEELDLPK